MDAEFQRRIAINESQYREANERHVAGLQGFHGEAAVANFTVMCECAVTECADMLDVTPAEYHRTRSNPAWFIVEPEHVLAGSEQVVEKADRFWIIEKIGAGAAVAVELADPRAPHQRAGRPDLLGDALFAARAAEKRAEALARSARARIADADARATDADAQTLHAKTGILAAEAHMEAARLHMDAAKVHEADAHILQDRADAQMAEAVALLEAERDDSQEYQRAIYHYTQLVRHRMANPLQTISGMAQTLREQPDMDPQLRSQMIVAIYEQSQALAQICLEPRILDDAERELRPLPFT